MSAFIRWCPVCKHCKKPITVPIPRITKQQPVVAVACNWCGHMHYKHRRLRPLKDLL